MQPDSGNHWEYSSQKIMDKVDLSTSTIFNPSLYAGVKPQEKKDNVRGRGKTLFSDMMERSVAGGVLGPIRELAPSEEALIELMDAVHSAGSDLKERPLHEEILNYKRAVRNFINYVVENSFNIEITQTKRRELRNLKPHIQIRVIDHKLEELAAAILSGQIDQLKRVSKIDEITGLLVDLTITGVIKERND